MRLLTEEHPAITIVRGDSSAWTALGEPFDGLACGRSYEVYGDFCEPAPEGDGEEALTGFEAKPFGYLVRQVFGTRCEPEEAEKVLEEATQDQAEYHIGRALWFGIEDANWSGDIYLTSSQVARSAVDVNANPRQALAQLLQDAWEANPDLDPLIHLGMQLVMELGVDKLNALDVPYVVSPGYPLNGLAVTGPIEIRLGDLHVLRLVNQGVNRLLIEGTRMANFQFDPCLARLGADGS